MFAMSRTKSPADFRSVLIVDDDEDFAESVDDVLSGYGYATRMAHDFASAVAAVKDFQPDVAFVDVRLGSASGIELIPLIKTHRPDLICIVMTAYADTQTVIEALKLGAYDFLRKPLHAHDITALLDRCYEKLTLEHENLQALAALRASEERFRDLIEGSIQGIVIHRDFEPLFVNQAFADILGYASPEELTGVESLEPALDPAHVEQMKRDWQASQSTGDFLPTHYDLEAVRGDGKRVRLESFARRIHWDGGPAVQMTVIDITERVKLEAQLRQAQKMEAISQLASGVAHDLNNRLLIIRGYAEIADNHIDTDGELSGYLGQIVGAADGAADLIRQLLAFSRQELFRQENLEVNRLIGDLVALMRPLMGAGIELGVKPCDDAVSVRADGGMLEQMLMNICMNARDAMPDGGRLIIGVQRRTADPEFCKLHPWAEPGEYVIISVSDTGIGMSAEVRERVFEPFFTTREIGKGTGLGLSMAYGMALQQRGMIDVHSEPGIGTTFNVYLPTGEATQTELPSAQFLPT